MTDLDPPLWSFAFFFLFGFPVYLFFFFSLFVLVALFGGKEKNENKKSRRCRQWEIRHVCTVLFSLYIARKI